MKTIIVTPTYNERKNVEELVKKIFSINSDYHLLIIDDNSPDGTADIVKQLQKEFSSRLHILERKGKLGLGTAYITGFKWAIEHNYPIVNEMDADFSHPPDKLIDLHDAIANDNYDVAIGSRYISGVNVVNWPIGRVLMSYYASAYVRLVTGMKIMDTTAGFVCYKIDVLKTINLDEIKMKGYAFQIEMKFKAWKYKFKITEIPIIFHDRQLGNSKMTGGIFNEAVWGVLKMKIRSWFENYSR